MGSCGGLWLVFGFLGFCFGLRIGFLWGLERESGLFRRKNVDKTWFLCGGCGCFSGSFRLRIWLVWRKRRFQDRKGKTADVLHTFRVAERQQEFKGRAKGGR
jgi:hypothetical protein